MSLKYALLGMIAEKPGSGYALRKRFFSYLKPTLSQIYRTLADMTSEKLVDFNKIDQDNAPNKKVYYVTEAGQKDLDLWLENTMSSNWLTQRQTIPYLTQVWFSYRVNPDDVIKNLEAYKNELLGRNKWVEVEAAKLTKKSRVSKDGREKFFRDLAIKGSYMQLESIINWMDYTIDQVKQYKASLSSRAVNGRTRKPGNKNAKDQK
jgi:PadR family transcriptional regulator, regulatory protein AphA